MTFTEAVRIFTPMAPAGTLPQRNDPRSGRRLVFPGGYMSLARWLLLAALLLAVLMPASSFAQDVPSLDHARQLYNESRFSDAIAEVETLLRQGMVRGDQLNTVRELRARCLAKLGRRLEAQEAYLVILRSDASYRADPVVVPPDEIEPFRLALAKF